MSKTSNLTMKLTMSNILLNHQLTSGFKEFYGEPCSQIIDMDAAIEFREHCKEVSKDELDMIIKAECLPIGVLVVSPKPRNIK